MLGASLLSTLIGTRVARRGRRLGLAVVRLPAARPAGRHADRDGAVVTKKHDRSGCWSWRRGSSTSATPIVLSGSGIGEGHARRRAAARPRPPRPRSLIGRRRAAASVGPSAGRSPRDGLRRRRRVPDARRAGVSCVTSEIQRGRRVGGALATSMWRTSLTRPRSCAIASWQATAASARWSTPRRQRIDAVPFDDLSRESLLEHLDTDVGGAFTWPRPASRDASPGTTGRIVMITSAELDGPPTPGWTAYARRQGRPGDVRPFAGRRARPGRDHRQLRVPRA